MSFRVFLFLFVLCWTAARALSDTNADGKAVICFRGSSQCHASMDTGSNAILLYRTAVFSAPLLSTQSIPIQFLYSSSNYCSAANSSTLKIGNADAALGVFILRGGCSFADKVTFARRAGARYILIVDPQASATDALLPVMGDIWETDHISAYTQDNTGWVWAASLQSYGWNSLSEMHPDTVHSVILLPLVLSYPNSNLEFNVNDENDVKHVRHVQQNQMQECLRRLENIQHIGHHNIVLRSFATTCFEEVTANTRAPGISDADVDVDDANASRTLSTPLLHRAFRVYIALGSVQATHAQQLLLSWIIQELNFRQYHTLRLIRHYRRMWSNSSSGRSAASHSMQELESNISGLYELQSKAMAAALALGSWESSRRLTAEILQLHWAMENENGISIESNHDFRAETNMQSHRRLKIIPTAIRDACIQELLLQYVTLNVTSYSLNDDDLEPGESKHGSNGIRNYNVLDMCPESVFSAWMLDIGAWEQHELLWIPAKMVFRAAKAHGLLWVRAYVDALSENYVKSLTKPGLPSGRPKAALHKRAATFTHRHAISEFVRLVTASPISARSTVDDAAAPAAAALALQQFITYTRDITLENLARDASQGLNSLLRTDQGLAQRERIEPPRNTASQSRRSSSAGSSRVSSGSETTSEQLTAFLKLMSQFHQTMSVFLDETGAFNSALKHHLSFCVTHLFVLPRQDLVVLKIGQRKNSASYQTRIKHSPVKASASSARQRLAEMEKHRIQQASPGHNVASWISGCLASRILMNSPPISTSTAEYSAQIQAQLQGLQVITSHLEETRSVLRDMLTVDEAAHVHDVLLQSLFSDRDLTSTPASMMLGYEIEQEHVDCLQRFASAGNRSVAPCKSRSDEVLRAGHYLLHELCWQPLLPSNSTATRGFAAEVMPVTADVDSDRQQDIAAGSVNVNTTDTSNTLKLTANAPAAPIRVGFVSSFFRTHSVGRLLGGVIRGFDPSVLKSVIVNLDTWAAAVPVSNAASEATDNYFSVDRNGKKRWKDGKCSQMNPVFPTALKCAVIQ